MIFIVGSPYELDFPNENSEIRKITPDRVLRYLEDKAELQIDTESEGTDPHTHSLITLQIGDGKHQFVIDVRHVPITLFKGLLEKKLCLLQNAKHDYKMLRKAGIVLENIYDTMLAECVIFNGYDDFGYSLFDLCKRYLKVRLDKEPRSTFQKLEGSPLNEKQIRYAAADVTYLQAIRDGQKKFIEKYDLGYAVDLENRAVKSLGDIEYNGMYLQPDEWLAVSQKKKLILRKLEIDMDEFLIDLGIGYRVALTPNLFGYSERLLEINYGSSQQCLNMLRKAGIPANSTNAFELDQFRDKEAVQKLTDVRELRTALSKYGEAFLDHINPNTGRVHTDFWQVQNTFRLSSSNPNLQNIPKKDDYRNCFKPRPGYDWLSIDYSGQEMRLMFDYAGEDEFVEAVNNGEDPHCFVGTMMFGKPITKGTRERQEAKEVNFGKPYGMGPDKLARKLHTSQDVAQQKLSLHERTFPRLDRYLKAQARFGVAHGYVMTNPIHKGRRWFPNVVRLRELQEEGNAFNPDIYRIRGSIERQAMNLSIQGSGAVMMKEALIQTREVLKVRDGYLISTVHDEVNLETEKSQSQLIQKEVSDQMIEVGQKYVKAIKMPVDGSITDYWIVS